LGIQFFADVSGKLRRGILMLFSTSSRKSGRVPYKWIVMMVVIFGSFMSILDQSVMNNALPSLQSAFATDLGSLQWVIERSWGVLKPGGILVTTAAEIDPEAVAARGVRGTGMLTQPNGAQLAEIAAFFDTGVVKPVVSTILDLSEAARAHTLAGSGHVRGKIVLRISA
jgi:D-arabinose 1-dehydrogenase-like Zn-dependent alcohol dehydrogenase